MGLKQREWARSQTLVLRELLGGACAHCGVEEKLEFDCIEPCGHWHHKIEWSWRISFYRQQLRVGNLQLLCQTCNSRKESILLRICGDVRQDTNQPY